MMGILLGNHDFADTVLSALEKHEETGGRDARRVTLTGLVRGGAVSSLEAALDAVMAAASEGQEAPLRLRPGREMRVRRVGYTREVQRDAGIARFTLLLDAEDPFEYAAEEEEIAWTLDAPDASRLFEVAGNVAALPRIALTAAVDLARPGFTDGDRALRHDGTLLAGQTMVVDAMARTIHIDGEDVSPYSLGLFPELAPGAATLAFLQDGAVSAPGNATVAWRARWW